MLDNIPATLKTTAVDELRAQSFYRLGRHQEALSVYMQLFDVKSSADEFQTERICNALCVLTKLHEEDIPNVPDFTVPQSVKRYEVEFNSASLDIAKGHFSKAQQRLAKSIELYKNEVAVQQIPDDEAADEIAMLEKQRDFAQSIESLKTEPGTPAPPAPTGKSKSKKGDASKTAAQPAAAEGSQSTSSLVTPADLDGLENNFWSQFVTLKRKATAKAVAQPASKATKTAASVSAPGTESGDAKKKKKKKAETSAAGSSATAGGAKGGKSPSAGASSKVAAVAGVKKKKRKVRLPKNYDPNTLPDPERWLPMHERSYYRGKKRRDKQNAIGKGTQGAVSTTQGDSSTPIQSHYSPATLPAAAGPRQQQGPAGGKKKSGAGGRRGGGKR